MSVDSYHPPFLVLLLSFLFSNALAVPTLNIVAKTVCTEAYLLNIIQRIFQTAGDVPIVVSGVVQPLFNSPDVWNAESTTFAIPEAPTLVYTSSSPVNYKFSRSVSTVKWDPVSLWSFHFRFVFSGLPAGEQVNSSTADRYHFVIPANDSVFSYYTSWICILYHCNCFIAEHLIVDRSCFV